jgi:hypothetical protein
VLELIWRVGFAEAVRAFDKLGFYLVGNEIACRVEHTQSRPKLDCLVRKFTATKNRCLEIDIGKKRVNDFGGT